jgi:8-amino-7-oxononanoate synthase
MFHVKQQLLGCAPVSTFREAVRDRLQALENASLRRHPRSIDGPQDAHLWVDGRRVLCLCSNNYLGLARHPVLIAAIREALDAEGVGAGGSRQISGSMHHHRRAESAFAAFWGQEASVGFATGFACNVGTLQALATRDDVIFSDRLNHASLVDGMRLSRAQVVIYEHADAADLGRKLAQHRARGKVALIVTESLFSMDGDYAPVSEIAALAGEYGAGLVVDEAHAAGVIGPQGRGYCAQQGVRPDVLIGTLGKAFGGQGAFAAADWATADLIRNRARSYVYSTAPAPVLSAAAVAALRLVRESDALRERLAKHASRLRAGLQELGFHVLPGDSAIIPVVLGSPESAVSLSAELYERGLFVHGVRPPTVPVGTSRLRVIPMASHTDEDISMALSIFGSVRQ